MLNIIDTRQRVEQIMNLDTLTQDQLKTYYTNRWCIEQGIKSRDLTNHPRIDDAILLVNIREEFWNYLNAQDRGVWAAYWKRVYHLQFSLNKKSLKKLEKIVSNGIYWQHQAQLKRQQIKQLRESRT